VAYRATRTQPERLGTGTGKCLPGTPTVYGKAQQRETLVEREEDCQGIERTVKLQLCQSNRPAPPYIFEKVRKLKEPVQCRGITPMQKIETEEGWVC